MDTKTLRERVNDSNEVVVTTEDWNDLWRDMEFVQHYSPSSVSALNTGVVGWWSPPDLPHSVVLRMPEIEGKVGRERSDG